MTEKLEAAQVNEENLHSAKKKSTSAAPWKRIFNILGNVVFAVILLSMAFLVFSMVQSRIKGGPPGVAGYQLYIVLGGSMSPAFEAGSLAVLEPVNAGEIGVGDIITYRSAAGSDGLTTHRVMEVHDTAGRPSFTTRGDANDVNDPEPVLAQNLVGRVVYAIPYAGFVMHYSQTRMGLIFMVFIPGALIIFFELRYLLRCAAEMEREKEGKKAQEALASGEPEHNPGDAPHQASL